MPYQYPLPICTGSVPGRLDPHQPSRVLHAPDSTLSFAIYDARTARNDLDDSEMPDIDNPSVRDELCKGRRIVIETSASGDSSWRYVPRAHLLHGVQDEGIFPRQVVYCGMRLVFSQDQWDIHKLDPAFTCTVHPDPNAPTIELKHPPSSAFGNQPPASTSNCRPATGLHTPPHNDENSPHSSVPPSKRPKATTSSDSSEEEKMHRKKRSGVTVDSGSVYSAMSVDTAPSPPQTQPFGFQYQQPCTPPFADPAGVEDLHIEEQASGSNMRKRKLSPTIPQAKSRTRSSAEPETPKRPKPSNEPPSPKKPSPNPFMRAFVAKAYDKRKAQRNEQRRDRWAEAFAHRHMQELAEQARLHQQQQHRLSQQFQEQQAAQQQDENSKPREFNKPKEKGSDHMSWTESPLWTEEEIREAMGNPPPNPNPNWNNQFNTPPTFGAQPSWNPQTGFAPGFGPQPQSEFNPHQEFNQGFVPQPDFGPGFTPFADFNGPTDPSQNEFFIDEDELEPESSPTPRASPEPEEGSRYSRWQSEPAYSDHEDRRRAELLKSMHKMHELEKDRPLWEAAARQRRAYEEREAQERESRRQQREHARAQDEYARSQAQAQQRFADEEEIRLRKEQAREQFLAQQHYFKERAYQYRRWTSFEAVSRYQELGKEFDSTNFSGMSLTFDHIPWPITKDPQVVTFQDITWESIEAFFSAAEGIMDGASFRTFVHRSNVRFHPDRWRSRGTLTAVVNEIERDCLAEAANIVSQALTPIWSRIKQRAE